MIKIKQIEADSIAAELGIKSGDQIISINDNDINDQLDFRFYSAAEMIELLVERGSERIIFEIEKEYHQDLGLLLEEMKMKACGNNCIFCFVHQNPRGMRRALYFKDEDYRFSFLYGHYVTLTTLKHEELERIVKQQLSPLYISVHATEENTRKQLLGINRDDHLFDKIDFLIKGGIELHAQIVLCPGINDGDIFDQTVYDLKQFYPGVKSIAIVPVGLTRHRHNLYHLRLHSVEELQAMISYTDGLRNSLYNELGNAFVYLSDEFFIKADQQLPGVAYYDDFYQIENGVGEFREMIDRFNQEETKLPKGLEQPFKITWITGTLAAGNLERHILTRLRKIENLEIDLVPVRNDFYGQSIEVSGLLVGQDIYRQLHGRMLGDVIFLPPRVLNHQGLFLDDWRLSDLQDKLETQVCVYQQSLSDIGDVISKLRVKQ